MFPTYLVNNNNDFAYSISIHEITNDVPPHGHGFLELHYVFQGEGIEKINGVSYDMKPGTFAVIFPHQIHEMIIGKGSTVFLYNLCISTKALFDQDESGLAINKLLFDIDLNPITIYNIDDLTSQKFNSILCEMNSEYHGEKVWKTIMLKAKMLELFVLFDRYRRSLTAKKDESNEILKLNDTWSIIHYVYKHSDENITLKYLSELFYLSVPYICTTFKQCLGISFHVFLRNLRIENACSLLTSSKISITDVAYQVGYSSYSTFVRVFHTCKGVSPANYRRRVSNI